MSRLAITSTSLLASVRLTDRRTFPPWYAQLKYHAQAQQIWDQINPELPAPANPLAVAPAVPDLATADEEALKLYQIKLSIHGQLAAKLQGIWGWIYATVDANLLELAILRAEDQSLHALLKAIKKDHCPDEEDWKEQVRLTYREVIQRPHSRSPTPEGWILEWSKAYTAAKSLDLEEIKGTLPIRDFIRAASKYHPTWAERELEILARPGSQALTLEQYAEWFSQLVYRKESGQGVYATLGAISDKKQHSCPCRESSQHSWRPIDCARLEYALRGASERELRSTPSAEEIADIKKRLDSEQYKGLREALAKKGWYTVYPGSITA
jgi:hypothetical protein